jgi:hypothetical protein
MRKSLFSLSLLVLALLFCTVARAQDLASITGLVTDTTGAVIPAATVILQNPGTNVSYKTTTNSLGSYTFANVAPGPGYKLTVAAQGFEPEIVTGVYLNVNSTRTQNIKLSVGSSSETVQVSASSENVTLNTTDASVGNNFQVQMLNDLPVQSRDSPAALFYQQPGVTLQGAVTGARTDQSNVTVDGLMVNDLATGGFGDIVATAPVDSVQEFRGTVADPTADSGQGGGGQFQLVTKSGSNTFHGDLNEYHRDTDLEANDWFNNNAGAPRPPLVRNQFGGQVGGPIWRNKAFFFFDYDGRRDSRSTLVDRTVPLGGVAGQSGCAGSVGYREGYVCYINSTGNVVSLTPAQVASLDPQGIGWDQAELQLFQSRYPVANDLTGDVGDMVNTAGYRFNAPNPYTEDVYVQRVDYTLNDKMKLYAKATVARINSLENPVQFPGDPVTYPFIDHSYNCVVGHTWSIGGNKLNQAEFGETFENYNFDVAYNPQGANQFSYAGFSSSGPYGGGNNSQARTYPVPVFRDDFSWEKGRHSITFGGLFSWQSPDEFAAENYNFPDIGISGNTNFTALDPSLRPSDISSNPSAVQIWDNQFSTALGATANVNSNFNYDNKGNVQQQGSGLSLDYRNYVTELYFSDSWKVTPSLTLTYGLRYQNYSVPYEIHGLQASAQLLDASGSANQFSFDNYWADREAQSSAGISSNTALPLMQYIYGGKANNAAGYYQPANKNFAPRFAFAYNPEFDKKTVISGSANVVYDYTIVNALQFQQLQASYLFEASNNNLFGIAGDPYDSLASSDPNTGGLPRFAGVSSPPPAPTAPTITTPFQPFVVNVPNYGPYPYGLPYGEFNILVNPQLKTPYNIVYDFGVQHEFAQGYILKVNYSARLGRRLLAEADASQLVEFPDNSGKSTQTMSQAMGALTTQLRQFQAAGQSPLQAIGNVTAQPWFEDVITPGVGQANGFNSNTQMIADEAYPYPQRGDFADTMYVLSTIGFPFNSILPLNVGMPSQFSSNTIWTNKGFSSYNAMLVTLHKNAGYGLQFDLNYTWSHSIDNVSAVANFIAGGEGYGFICDIQRPRECRGNSDFDVTNMISGNFIYDLPFGRGRSIGANMPFWANEALGGWELSGLPSWHTGYAYNIYSNAFVAGFATDAPATLIGSPALLKTHVQHSGNGQPVNAFANSSAALAAMTGPTGFNIGERNNFRGPGYFDMDLGLGKTFPVRENLNVKFRCDAFNVFNHPNFNTPSSGGTDITESSGVPFGTITSTVVPPGSDLAVRVLQGSLRVEF